MKKNQSVREEFITVKNIPAFLIGCVILAAMALVVFLLKSNKIMLSIFLILCFIWALTNDINEKNKTQLKKGCVFAGWNIVMGLTFFVIALVLRWIYSLF